jgi:hypothetical protein
MTTSTVIHSANALIDWIEQKPVTPENERLIAALTSLRDTALLIISEETGDNGN